ncbi:hypothetical protein ACHAPF_007880 [Botrytis cinerea]
MDRRLSQKAILTNALRSHGLWKRFSSSEYEELGAIFHMTFYEMIRACEDRRNIWKIGTFHNDNVRNWEPVIEGREKNNLVLRLSCATIVGIIDYGKKWSPENWSIDGEHAVDREFIVAFSGIIDRSTRDIIRHWDILANYFEKLLSESDTLLEPDLHDLLLVDDWKYSKSKRCFWALNILKEIETDIAAVVSQLEGFMDFSEKYRLKTHFPLPGGKISAQREKIVKEKSRFAQGRFH